MADTNTSNKKILILPFRLELTQARFQALAEMTEGNGAAADKVEAVVVQLARDIADGGLLLTADEVKRITEATGLDPSCGEDLLPFLSEATGIEEGMHVVKAKIDPVYWTRIGEIAEFRGWPAAQLVQEMVDHCLENNWYEEIVDQPRHVRMVEQDAKALEEVLGGKFSTGTELAKLIQSLVGGDAVAASGAEQSNVGSEAAA